MECDETLSTKCLSLYLESRSYDAGYRLLTSTDSGGRTTSYTYNAVNWERRELWDQMMRDAGFDDCDKSPIT